MLGDYDGSRRNNFTALRIVFAWSVLFGHSFSITGYSNLNPLKSFFEGSIWIGAIAVNGFFVISGFLVAASLLRRGTLDYGVSRCLRIYPALIVCVVLTVFLLGPLTTTLSLRDYLGHEGTWSYLWNATALFNMQFGLPGVFEDLPRNAVNGSLWTLTVELSCYLLLAIGGLLGLLQSRVVANLALLALFLFGLFFFEALPLVGRQDGWSRLGVYFLLGVTCYVNRGVIPLDGRMALGAVFAFYAGLGETWFTWVAPPALTYVVFFLAYRTPFLNLDARFGDPSYGIYIYAWPVQQLLVTLFPGEGPYFNTVVASVIVVTLALASWHLVEKPCLGLKRRLLASGS
jgi:peptidoglycan/LPS O-acetylase OafA/YrhL